MTAKPDLLPLLPLGECSEDSVREWCRANVAHATAARDAEVEALRAEVSKYKTGWEEFSDRTEWVQQTAKPRELGMHRADVLRLRIEQAEARAERLAEALRIAEAALADIGDADREPGDDVSWCERRAALGLRVVRDTLRNADLNPTAAQENDDAT